MCPVLPLRPTGSPAVKRRAEAQGKICGQPHLWGSWVMSPCSRAASQVAPLRAARRALQRRRTPPAPPDGPGSSSMASPGCTDGAAVGRQPVRAPGRGEWAGPARPVVNTTAQAGEPHNDLNARSREIFVAKLSLSLSLP